MCLGIYFDFVVWFIVIGVIMSFFVFVGIVICCDLVLVLTVWLGLVGYVVCFGLIFSWVLAACLDFGLRFLCLLFI